MPEINALVAKFMAQLPFFVFWLHVFRPQRRECVTIVIRKLLFVKGTEPIDCPDCLKLGQSAHLA
jgi:hypothetical protein